MKRLRDISVRTKLWSGFVVAFALVAVMSMIGIVELRTHDEFATDVVGVTLPEIMLLGDIDRGMVKHRVLAQQRMATVDLRQLAQIDDAMEQTSADVDAAVASYAAIADTAVERDRASDLAASWETYKSGLASVLRGTEIGERGRSIARFTGEVLPTLDAATSQVNELLAFSKTEASQAAAVAQTTYAAISASIAAALLVAAAMLSGGLIWVSTSISGPIQRATAAMRRLIAGDELAMLDGDPDRKDEIGTLVAAAAGYRDSLIGQRRLARDANAERQRFALALNSMPIGLSMFDDRERLVTSNRQWSEMYGLPESLSTPGARWADIVQRWIDTGNYPGDDAGAFFAYLRRLGHETAGSTTTMQVRDGRTFSIIHQPLAEGGWIATHEDVTARYEAERRVAGLAEEAERERQRFGAAISNMPVGLSMYGRDRRLIVCNDRFRELYGLPPELTKAGASIDEILDHSSRNGRAMLGNDTEQLRKRVLDSIGQRSPRTDVYKLQSGQVISVTLQPMADGGWVSTHEDVTARREAEQRIARLAKEAEVERQRLSSAMSNLPLGVVMFDAEQRLIVANDCYVELYQMPPELAKPGTPLGAILENRVKAGRFPGRDASKYVDYLANIVRRGESFKDLIQFRDGRIVSLVYQPLAGGGWVSTHEDVTDRRNAEAKIAHMTRHDGLTDLPNRILLRERIEDALVRAGRDDQTAILCLDIDHFKGVNDTLGHTIGDELLLTVAKRLTSCVRGTDMVARLGGDEFAIIQAGALQPQGARTLAQRVIESVGAPYVLGGHKVVIGVSIGVGLAPTDGGDADQLLKAGDMALHRAKADGRGRYRFFEREMDARMQSRRALELDLRRAIETGQFELYYQPQFDLATNTIDGFEALLRWHHPERGLVMPLEFIPLAEETGLILPLGEWVLKRACKEAMNWPSPVKVAVNLSPAQFRSAQLLQSVIAALAASKLPASRLELEITELVLLAENESTLATLHRLRSIGVRISMDDFGTGYSSLSYLQSFPFDKIKIDRRFITDVNTDASSLAIIRAVTGLSASLGITTTAEGVETREQFDRVKAEGCTQVQGFLTGRPMPLADAIALFRRPGSKASAA